MLSRRFASVVTILVVVAFVVVAVAPAFAATPRSLAAHAQLLGSTPRDGSTLETADEVVLEFNEDVDATFVTVLVEGPSGSEAAGDPTVVGRAVTQALPPGLAAGEHVVTYRVVSTDGHPIAGRLTFTTTSAPTAATSPEPTASASATASASVSAIATASAAPTAAPTAAPAAPTTAPAADEGASPWPWVLGGLGLIAVLAGLVTVLARRSPGPGAAVTRDDVPTASGTDPSRDDARGPFA
ncbi:MAG TPA: copper resistance CopC family protein [Ornithinibacter sp.]|nr:copper resistance CopC family protein [Ornithinibacter sp.]